MTLTKEGGALVVRVRGASLMSSRVHGSEEAMAEVGCVGLSDVPHPSVLIGGLGMGYTLRATLDALGPGARVIVSELVPAIVEWNRGPLGPLASHPLDDPRVELRMGEVQREISPKRGARRERFHAILLDVDNGPEAFTTRENAWIYGDEGLACVRDALVPGGRVVVWSAFQSAPFERRLRAAGMQASAVPVRARGKVAKGSRHVLYVGTRR